MSYETRYAAAKRAQMDRLLDSPEAVAWRIKSNAMLAQVQRERMEKYPAIDFTNFEEALEWQERRIAELMAQP